MTGLTYFDIDGKQIHEPDWYAKYTNPDYGRLLRAQDPEKTVEVEASWLGLKMSHERPDRAGLWCVQLWWIHPDIGRPDGDSVCEFFPTHQHAAARARQLLGDPPPAPDGHFRPAKKAR